MLQNATLRRVDPPAPGPPGEPIAVRCTLNPPTDAEVRWMGQSAVAASAVLYLLPPAGDGPPAASPTAGGRVVVELDGRPPAAWAVVDVVERAGDVIRYTQVFLAATGESAGV